MKTFAKKTRMGISEKEIKLFEAGIRNSQDGKVTEYIRDTVIDSLIFDLELTSEEIGLPLLSNKELLKLVWKAAELRGLGANAYIREALGARWDDQGYEPLYPGRPGGDALAPWHDRRSKVSPFPPADEAERAIGEGSFASVLLKQAVPATERW
jgi:hypothetical protein